MVCPSGRLAQGSEPGARIRRRFHLSSEPALRSPSAGHGRRRLHRPRSPLVRVRALDPPPRKPALSFTKTETKATRLLVISRGAGSMNEEVEKELRSAFADHLIVDFDPHEDIEKLVSSRARIIVAGGGGTLGFMGRKVAGSPHPHRVNLPGSIHKLPPRIRL